MSDQKHLLRRLPNVGNMLSSPELALECESFGRQSVTAALRAVADDLRSSILDGDDGAESRLNEAAFVAEVKAHLSSRLRERQVPVINGTGVILHTSLGRAVLPEEAWEFASRVAKSYSMLELDQASGKRGDRDRHVFDLLCDLTGAEAATVVNNNAAATMLIMNELSNGKETVISRAHMVEIGGSYRMMDVMRMSGAAMVEVGATNKCKASDYANGVSDNTGCIMKVHTSNYEISGFTHFASLEELVAIGKEHKVPVVFDLGAGSLVDLRPFGLDDEPIVPELINTGADLVCFSGDKLVGGPQAGIVVGKREYIERLKANQMFRMLRCDKITLALLEATLRLYLDPEKVWERVPTLHKISEELASVQKRANTLASALPASLSAKAVEHAAFVGGGSLPTQKIESAAVEITKVESIDRFAEGLRVGTPSVFGRIENDRFLLDCRTIAENEVEAVAAAVAAASSAN